MQLDEQLTQNVVLTDEALRVPPWILHESQFHEVTRELTSKVNSHYLSRSQWLQLPNPTARRRI